MIVFAVLVGIQWYQYSGDKECGAILHMMEFAPIMMCVFVVCVFGVLWLFYIEDVLEEHRLHGTSGYWFGRSHQNE